MWQAELQQIKGTPMPFAYPGMRDPHISEYNLSNSFSLSLSLFSQLLPCLSLKPSAAQPSPADIPCGQADWLPWMEKLSRGHRWAGYEWWPLRWSGVEGEREVRCGEEASTTPSSWSPARLDGGTAQLPARHGGHVGLGWRKRMAQQQGHPLPFEGLRGGFSQLRKQFRERGSAAAHFLYLTPLSLNIRKGNLFFSILWWCSSSLNRIMFKSASLKKPRALEMSTC